MTIFLQNVSAFIEKAKDLLRGSDLSVPEITARVGYQDHSSFRRKSKNIVECSVAEYRLEAVRQKKRRMDRPEG